MAEADPVSAGERPGGLDPVASSPLCPVESPIGTGEEHVDIGIRAIGGRDADADRRPLARIADPGQGEIGANSLRNDFGGRSVGADEHDREFFPAEATDNVARPHLAPDDGGERAERGVADNVAEAIVDRLEPINRRRCIAMFFVTTYC